MKQFGDRQRRDRLVAGEQAAIAARDDPCAVTVGRRVLAERAVAMTRPSISSDMKPSLMLIAIGSDLLSPKGQTRGANVLSPPPAQRDPLRAFAQVRRRNPRFGSAQTRAYPP